MLLTYIYKVRCYKTSSKLSINNFDKSRAQQLTRLCIAPRELDGQTNHNNNNNNNNVNIAIPRNHLNSKPSDPNPSRPSPHTDEASDDNSRPLDTITRIVD